MNTAFKDVTCSSAVEFLDKLRDITRDNSDGRYLLDRWAFRGQKDANWALVPSAFREGTCLGYALPDHMYCVREAFVDSSEQKNAEFFAVYEFFILADKLGLAVPGDKQIFRVGRVSESFVGHSIGTDEWPPEDIWPLLAIAQHYGVPTRFLDFSFRWSVAAYFAAQDAVTRDRPRPERIAVWAVDLECIFYSAKWGHEVRVVMVPRSSNRNLHEQHGLFLFDFYRPDKKSVALDSVLSLMASRYAQSGKPTSDRNRLVKVTIHTEAAPEILRLLAIEGVDEAHLRPSFPSVVRELERQRGKFTS